MPIYHKTPRDKYIACCEKEKRCPICELFEEKRMLDWECNELLDEVIPTNFLKETLPVRDLHALEEVDQEFV